MSHNPWEFVDRLVDECATKSSDTGKACREDPQFYYELSLLRRFLSSTEEAMQQEGIERGVQERVLRTIAHWSAPDEVGALRRILEMAKSWKDSLLR